MNIKLNSFACVKCGNQQEAFVTESASGVKTLHCPTCFNHTTVNAFSDASGAVVHVSRRQEVTEKVHVAPKAEG